MVKICNNNVIRIIWKWKSALNKKNWNKEKLFWSYLSCCITTNCFENITGGENYRFWIWTGESEREKIKPLNEFMPEAWWAPIWAQASLMMNFFCSEGGKHLMFLLFFSETYLSVPDKLAPFSTTAKRRLDATFFLNGEWCTAHWLGKPYIFGNMLENIFQKK